jgi:hypothetical protein
MAAHGWDKMSWEERKAMGLMGRGFYTLDPYADRFRDATPAARSDLTPAQLEKMAAGAAEAKTAKAATPPREPALYSLKFEGGEPVVVNKAAQPKPTPEQKKAKRAATTREKRELQQQQTRSSKKREELAKRLEELQRQSQGAKC